MHTKYTAKLSPDWDLQVGPDGNLQMLKGTEATCQNIANECRCFKGGLFYYQEHGIAWFNDQLAQKFRRSLIVSRLREAALNVVSAERIKNIDIKAFDTSTRTVIGQIEILTEDGVNAIAQL